MAEPVKIFYVGLGNFGLPMLAGGMQSELSSQGGYGRVVGIANRSLRKYDYMNGLFTKANVKLEQVPEARFKSIPQFNGLESDLIGAVTESDADLVVISTPDNDHHSYVHAALKSGKHVFVQKPMETQFLGAFENVALAKNNGLILAVDHHKQHDPAHRHCYELIQSENHRVLDAQAWMHDKITIPTEVVAWPTEESGTVLTFLAPHFSDLFAWFANYPNPLKVNAYGSRGILDGRGFKQWDSVKVQAEYEGGIRFSGDFGWIDPKGSPAVVRQGIRLQTDKAFFDINTQARGYEKSDANGHFYINPFFVQRDTDIDGNVIEKGYRMTNILNTIAGVFRIKSGKPLVGSLADLTQMGVHALNSVSVVSAAALSLETGLEIHVSNLKEIGSSIRDAMGVECRKQFYRGQFYGGNITNKRYLTDLVKEAQR